MVFQPQAPPAPSITKSQTVHGRCYKSNLGLNACMFTFLFASALLAPHWCLRSCTWGAAL